MTDREFAHAFFASLPEHRFGHREHLRLAWLALDGRDLGTATELVGSTIRTFAEAQGADHKYHQTLTEFWVRLVDHCRRDRPGLGDFDEFLEAFPLLLDSTLASRHWSDGALWNEAARAEWREPDLRPLPA